MKGKIIVGDAGTQYPNIMVSSGHSPLSLHFYRADDPEAGEFLVLFNPAMTISDDDSGIIFRGYVARHKNDEISEEPETGVPYYYTKVRFIPDGIVPPFEDELANPTNN